MGLAELLAADLLGWLERGADGVPRRVLLWLDPRSEFARLLPALEAPLAAAGAQLLTLSARNAQLPLKLALLRLNSNPIAHPPPNASPSLTASSPNVSPSLTASSPNASPSLTASSPNVSPSLVGKGPGDRPSSSLSPLPSSLTAVVYLPGFDRADLEPRDGGVPVLWSVYEQRFSGCIWGLGERWQPGDVPEPPRLLAWLRAHGLRTAGAEAALTAGGADSLLARYAQRRSEDEPRAWPRPLRISDVQAALGGDPRAALAGLLGDAEGSVAKWGGDLPLVLGRLREDYGLDLSPEAPPRELGDQAALLPALAGAWESFGEPQDFPYLSRLPAELAARRALAATLNREILPNDDLRRAFRARIEALEPQYDLSAWAEGRPGWPDGLPRLARARWHSALAALDHALDAGWREARSCLFGLENLISAGCASRWPDAARNWTALTDLVALCHGATAACDEAALARDAAALVQAYAERWSRVDSLHLAVRAACAQQPELESLRGLADRAYFEYVAAVNDRFAALIEQGGAWPPAGTVGVEAWRAALWGTEAGRSAVIVSDALRFDLARQVATGLDGCDLQPALSTLPSITPYGMTAMLPLREGEPVVRWAGGPSLKDHAGRSLAERSGRKELIAEVMAAQGRTVGFIEMSGLLRLRKPPEGDLLVVFDTNIDAQGHKGVDGFPSLAQKLVADLRRSIEKLHGFGIAVVHVLTDHGFLLLDPEAVAALGEPEVPLAQCTKREARWAALKPDAHAPELMRLPLPLAPAAGSLGLPRGVRTLVQPEPYMHGGLSLQECVIPVLRAVAVLPVLRVRPALSVAQARLATGTLAFSLRPAPLKQAPLGGVQPLRLRLVLERVSEPGRSIAEPKDEELRQETPEIKGALYIEEGHNLPAGCALALTCLDRETGEVLARVPLTLAVPWE